MAVSKKISELPVLITLDPAELIAVVDVTDGVTKQTTVDSIAVALRATPAETRALSIDNRLITPTALAQTFYGIRLFLGGTPTVQATTPQTSGWTIARSSTGIYTLTHSLDLTTQDDVGWQITPDASGVIGACINATKDTLTIQTILASAGTFADGEQDFMLLGFRFGE